MEKNAVPQGRKEFSWFQGENLKKDHMPGILKGGTMKRS